MYVPQIHVTLKQVVHTLQLFVMMATIAIKIIAMTKQVVVSLRWTAMITMHALMTSATPILVATMLG
jgi:hypothetical protein